jgi:hypothetical protein
MQGQTVRVGWTAARSRSRSRSLRRPQVEGAAAETWWPPRRFASPGHRSVWRPAAAADGRTSSPSSPRRRTVLPPLQLQPLLAGPFPAYNDISLSPRRSTTDLDPRWTRTSAPTTTSQPASHPGSTRTTRPPSTSRRPPRAGRPTGTARPTSLTSRACSSVLLHLLWPGRGWLVVLERRPGPRPCRPEAIEPGLPGNPTLRPGLPAC